MSRDRFEWNLSLRPCSHPKIRQNLYPKTSLGWSSPVPELLKQAMNDGRYTVWGILSCFPVGAACFGPDLTYEREERKLAGFINHYIKPGKRKGKLFLSSQRRFSVKKYWKWEWILGNGSILYRTLLMTRGSGLMACGSGHRRTGLQSLV